MQLPSISAAFGLAILALSSAVSAEGVFTFLSPNTALPAGCVSDYDKRFGFENVLISDNAMLSRFPMRVIPDSYNTLSMKLVNGVLFDRQGRIGSIVSNRQFQFDGPPAQAGAIYTAGWGVCPDDNVLTLGNQRVFYQCASGDFHNLYDAPVAPQCEPIYLRIVHIGPAAPAPSPALLV